MINKGRNILLILIILFIIITVLMKIGATNNFDSFFSNIIQNNISENFKDILKIITTLSGTKILPAIVITVTIILILNKKIKYAILIFGNSLLSIISYLGIKNIIQRPRPNPHFYITETGFSFPSGHTTCCAAFCFILIYIIWKKLKNKKLKIILTCLLVFWIMLIGVTRIYFNVHYPSDVLAGFILGGICVCISIMISLRLEKTEKNL